jgi:gliding motility-associated-like protein
MQHPHSKERLNKDRLIFNQLIALSHCKFLITRYSFLFLLAFAGNVNAQLCNGSLGDPVVNITFKSATDAQAPGYVFSAGSCPNDGYYTITPGTSNCFNNAWHTVLDHTGGGSFMLVNASYQPGDFFVQTVSDLCPNTNYEFAGWIMNVYSRLGVNIKPNLTFKIETPDGTVLNSFQTGDVPQTTTPEWKQYGFYFTTPATNAKIVLRITNNAPGGIGNDLALDDITFRPCGEKITASIVGNTDTVNICEGGMGAFTLNGDVSSAYQDPAYQWQLSVDKGLTWKDIAGATTALYQRQPTGSGNYWYRLTVLEAKDIGVKACRIASNVVVINTHSKPVVNAGADRFLINGEAITLHGMATGENLAFSWSPDVYMNNNAILNPTIQPTTDIAYTLAAKSEFGCTNQDEAFVKVAADIFIPNAFTPNDDGKNDTWKIPFLDPLAGAEVSLFNRYGQLVYHSKGAIVSWDGKVNGKLQPGGTYIYFISIKPGSFQRTGTVALIR